MREHLRVFVATGTGKGFPRLLVALRLLAKDPNVELFVQRGAAGPSFSDLPGEDFISREAFAKRLLWADCVVCHGGAGTLYEAHLAGHVPIVVPRLSRFGELVNDHQLELVTTLANANKVVLCDDVSRLRDLVLAAKRQKLAVAVQSELVTAVRKELLTPKRATLVGKILSLLE